MARASGRRAKRAPCRSARRRGCRRGGWCRHRARGRCRAGRGGAVSGLRSWPILRTDGVLEERLQPGERLRLRNLSLEQAGAEQVGGAVPVADRDVGGPAGRGRERDAGDLGEHRVARGRLQGDGDAAGARPPPRSRRRAGRGSSTVSYFFASIGGASASARPAAARSAGRSQGPPSPLPSGAPPFAGRACAARRQAEGELGGGRCRRAAVSPATASAAAAGGAASAGDAASPHRWRREACRI